MKSFSEKKIYVFPSERVARIAIFSRMPVTTMRKCFQSHLVHRSVDLAGQGVAFVDSRLLACLPGNVHENIEN